ncbi:hypothetical protein [Paenibacillus sp. Pae108]|uniref:hypothetical protein n=1 Tax=Paenibacillus sp. Pae108 TaxID=2926019 RepID=UPI002117DBD2|nr:hypothetical protein [Paenibacillus sp. Pae108]
MIRPDQRFELLVTVTKLAEKLYNEETWLCRCDCGEQTKATKSQLLGGKKKSCGCLRKKPPQNALDLTNQKFGSLKAVKRDGKTKNETALWLCECDCGNTIKANATLLRRREITSCGCERKAQIEKARNTLLGEKSVDGVPVPMLTKKVRSDSGTGHKGVHKRIRKGKEYYEAYITIKGKRKYAGPFKYLADAIAARKRLEVEYHEPYIKTLEDDNDE